VPEPFGLISLSSTQGEHWADYDIVCAGRPVADTIKGKRSRKFESIHDRKSENLSS